MIRAVPYLECKEGDLPVAIPKKQFEEALGRTVTPEELRTAITEGTPQPPRQAGKIQVTAQEWEDLQRRWETRLANQRQVVENLDTARHAERQQRADLLEKLKTVRDDVGQLVMGEPEQRHRENYRIIRDTLDDLIRVYR